LILNEDFERKMDLLNIVKQIFSEFFLCKNSKDKSLSICNFSFFQLLLAESKTKIMSTKSHVPSKITAAIAIIFLLPPLIFFMMWSSIGLRFTDMSMSDKTDTFLGYFPGFLKNLSAIQAISIVCCIIAIILASRSFKKHLLSIRVLMLLTVLLSIFIILFNIYQIISTK